LIDTFKKFENARIFTNACGPCIGQWDREGAEKQEKTLLFTLSTETLQKEQMVTQILTLCSFS
jgi:aconitase A